MYKLEDKKTFGKLVGSSLSSSFFTDSFLGLWLLLLLLFVVVWFLVCGSFVFCGGLGLCVMLLSGRSSFSRLFVTSSSLFPPLSSSFSSSSLLSPPSSSSRLLPSSSLFSSSFTSSRSLRTSFSLFEVWVVEKEVVLSNPY